MAWRRTRAGGGAMTAARETISDATTLQLWVQAGGRCEYHGCNEYLLEDRLTGYELNLAERAHIVGATDGSRSPRGDHPLPLEERSQVDNLMLLCRPHHRMIDRLIDEHGVEGLRRMKREHEDRVKLLTSLRDESATVVVRAIGDIRGAPVEIPRKAVQAAVVADGRFPRFPLAMAGEDVEIDLRNLPDGVTSDYWAMGERIIAQQADRLRAAQESIGHLSVFGLARIPLLVALGYHLDDKIPTIVYSRRRGGTGDGDWGFDRNAEPVSFDVTQLAGPADGSHVAVAVSVAASIGDDVVAATEDASVYEIRPSGSPCGRDLLDSRSSLDQFTEAYHRLLGRIEADHPTCEVIDLFAAVPAAGAVQMGRGLMRDVQPALRVHDRDGAGKFVEALLLGSATPLSQG